MKSKYVVAGIILFASLLFGFALIVVPPASPIDPFFDDIFPRTTPGALGAWEVYDYAPETQIPSPLKMVEVPGDDNTVLVISKIGEVWKMNLESLEQELALDIKDRCMKLGDAGIYGIAIHPKFLEGEEYQYVYLFYRYHPFNPNEWDREGYNRLSKFKWSSTDQLIDKDSEEVLIQQYDRNNWHSGGGLFFGNDGFLYLFVGDEGLRDEVDVLNSVQRFDGGLFSGVLRIDVDNDPSRSHPIVRQPTPADTIPVDWEPTFTQGYMIPNDNPWLSPSGEFLEEFYAIGLRSPYTAYYDPLEEEIWTGDVGSDLAEEIDQVEMEDNFQWPYKEGFFDHDGYSKPDPLIGNEKEPVHAYTRDIGTSVILGGVYRGLKFPNLDEKLLFADYTSSKIMAMDRETAEVEILIDGIEQFDIELPEEYGIVGVHITKDGTVLLTILSRDFWEPGRILALRNKEVVPDPPSKLSELGVFKDMQSREVVDAFIPYEVNAPLWSDRALKRRYVAMPNDGSFDSASERAKYNENDSWEFPVGTVFLKHFDLPTSLSNPDEVVPLETRFLVIAEDSIPYGLTYKWDENGEEAYLQLSKSSQEYEITDDGEFAFSQVWDYPSRSDCMTCHNAAAGFVLGLKTHQLNKEIEHPDMNISVNQLRYFNELGILDRNISSPEDHPKSYSLFDDSASLEERIRSYFDANCATCHRKGGIAKDSDMDLRYEIDLYDQNLIEYPTQSRASKNFLNVVPQDYEHSEIWVRDQSLGENRMPPLASNLVDQHYVDSLAKWIGEFQDLTPVDNEFFVSPGPADEYLNIEVGDNWLPAYEIQLYDIIGRLLLEESSLSARHTVDVSNVPPGVYVVVIHQGDKKAQQKISIL